MGGVNKVAVSGHHEANERDTHAILVEEDIRMGTVDAQNTISC